MSTTLGSRQNFQMWKWRALHKRRLFFLSLLQLICVFEWLVVFQSFQGAAYLSKSIENQQRAYERDFSSIPGVMFIIHFTFFLAMIFFKFVREKVDESQGRKICEVSVFSLLVAGLFCVYDPYDTHASRSDLGTSSASFAMLTVFGMTACQHLGLNETDTVLARLGVVALWIVFFCLRPCDFVIIVAVLLNVFSVFCGSSLQEHEFLRTFTKQKDINSSSYGRGNLVGDVVFALRSMEATVVRHYALLESEGLCRTFSAGSAASSGGSSATDCKLLLGAERAEDECGAGSAGVLVRPSDVWEWNYQAASLRANAMLCQAVYLATTSREDHRSEASSEFLFSRVCHEIFALFEGVCGSALTLYVNEANGPVYITARRTAFELMLFLLIHDFVHAKNRGLCLVSCDSIGTDSSATWRIRLQVATTEAERRRTTIFADNTNDKATSSLPLHDASARGLGTLGGGGQNAKSLARLVSEAGSLGRGLQLDENAWDEISSMDRLAERISQDYFSALLDVGDPQYLCGLKISRKFLKMPRDTCASSPGAFRGVSAGGLAANDRRDFVGTSSVSPGTTAKDSLLVCNVRYEWVFLVQRQPQAGGGGNGGAQSGIADADCFADLRDKMRSLSVPHCLMTLAELQTTACRHCVVVIHEPYLLKLCRDEDGNGRSDTGESSAESVATSSSFPFRSAIAAVQSHAVDLVVVWDVGGGSVPDLKGACGVGVAAGLSAKATMLEVLAQVRAVTTRQPPRKLVVEHLDGTLSTRAMEGAGIIQSQAGGVALRPRPGPAGESSYLAVNQPRPQRHHVIAREHERSHDRAKCRWLMLVRRFDLLTRTLFPDCREFTSHVLRSRVAAIEQLKLEDRCVLLTAAESGEGRRNGSERVYSGLSAHKRAVKFVLDEYLPVLADLRRHLQSGRLRAMLGLTVTYSVSSSNLGLVRLSCWFNTLQEAVRTVDELMGVKPPPREEGAPSEQHDEREEKREKRQALQFGGAANDSKSPGVLGDLTVLDAFGGEGDEARVPLRDSSQERAAADSAAASAVSVELNGALEKLLADMVDGIEVSVWDAAADK